MTDWPKREDGTNKKVGEMTREEQVQVFRDAGKRLQAEFDRPAVKEALSKALSED